MYEVGKVYIWQNQVGVYACLNGVETTVLDEPLSFNDIDTGKIKTGQETDTMHRGLAVYAEVGDLRPKDPPKGEQSILDLFKLPELEPA